MRHLGPEAARNYERRRKEGFFDRYLSGPNVLDIGFRGGDSKAVPITDTAVGVELDYPGYDGRHLPFSDKSQDAIFCSHCLEHIDDYQIVLADWYRVLKVGGYLVIIVPHRDLYERKAAPPSRFNGDHKRFYTPASLLHEIEESLPTGAFRVRSLRDLDDGFDYSRPHDLHAVGSYEIELVVEKITLPPYADKLLLNPTALRLLSTWGTLLLDLATAQSKGDRNEIEKIQRSMADLPLPPFPMLVSAVKKPPQTFGVSEIEMFPKSWFRDVLRPLLATIAFDPDFYLRRYADVAKAAHGRDHEFAHRHFLTFGYFEGRLPNADPSCFD